MQIIHYSCQMLMKLGFSDTSQKYPQIQSISFQWDPICFMPTGGETNMTKQIIVLPNF